ncbi:hypothetical protein VC116063_003313 [Vibrio cholerae O1 str. 116063]|nr:hypothetical protein VC116063_003313 [Vibrio cholerae O1 str. 116063]
MLHLLGIRSYLRILQFHTTQNFLYHYQSLGIASLLYRNLPMILNS